MRGVINNYITVGHFVSAEGHFSIFALFSNFEKNIDNFMIEKHSDAMDNSYVPVTVMCSLLF